MKYRGRVTHTFAELEVSKEAFLEIYGLLAEAGYHHAFVDGERVIDMHGIGLVMRKDDGPQPGDLIGGRYLIQERLTKESHGDSEISGSGVAR